MEERISSMNEESALSPGSTVTEYGANKLSASLNSLRKEGALCDIKLVVERHEYPAHKIVLSSFSPVFKGMFCGNFEEASKPSVTLSDIEAAIMENILDYAYTGHIEITLDNASMIFGAAHFLQVDSLISKSLQFLKKHIDFNTWLDIYKLADVYSCCSLKKKVEDFMVRKFIRIGREDAYLETTLELFDRVIQRNDLDVRSFEKIVFEAVIKWIEFKEDRRPFLPKLLRHVRIGLLDPEYLRYFIKSNATIWSSLECVQLLLEMQLDPDSAKPRYPHPVYVKVKTQNRKYFCVHVNCWDSIEDLKAKIEDETLIPVNRQILLFRGKQLENVRTISYYNIQHECVLEVIKAANMTVFVKTLDGKVFTLDLKGSDSIEYVQDEILRVGGISPSEQRLVFDQKQLATLGVTLSDYNVRTGSTIFLIVRLRGGKDTLTPVGIKKKRVDNNSQVTGVTR